MARATLHICLTCRKGMDIPADGMRPGVALLDAIAALVAEQGLPAGVTIRGVECLSACNTGCAVALSAPAKWSYVYGHMDPAAHAAAILDGAARYAVSADGIVPWRERPEIFRRQSIARIPPLETEP